MQVDYLITGSRQNTAPFSAAPPASKKRQYELSVETPQTKRVLAELLLVIAVPEAFDLARARQLAALALHDDESFDYRLISIVRAKQSRLPDQAIRLIRVLEQVCAKSKLLDHLLRITPTSGRVHSKVTLTIGRLVQNAQWLQEQLGDKSSRVRANAVEALWNVPLEGVDNIFLEALSDRNNRVVANAALGLYKRKHYRSIRVLYELLEHKDEVFRRSALWAIGQTDDTRFLPELHRVFSSVSTTDGERIFARQAIVRLENALAVAGFAARVHVDVARVQHQRHDYSVAKLTCSSPADNLWYGYGDLNRIDFTITEGNQPVSEFNLKWLEPRSSLSAVMVVPDSWGAYPQRLRSLWPNPSEAESSTVLVYPSAGSDANYLEDAEILHAEDEEIPEAIASQDGTYRRALSLLHAMLLGLRALDARLGSKHLFVLIDPSYQGQIPPRLASLAQAAGVTVHGLVWRGAERQLTDGLRKIARGSGGRFARCITARALNHCILAQRSAHFASLELSWVSNFTVPQPTTISYIGPLGAGHRATL